MRVMRHPEVTTSDQIARNQHFTLLELLDRLLDKGVMVKGEILLSVAEIDLVYLNLGLLLSSVKTVEDAAKRSDSGEVRLSSWPASSQGEFAHEPQLEAEREDPVPRPLAQETDQRKSGSEKVQASMLSSALDDGLNHFLEPRATIDPKGVEKGVIKLVLTLVDLIRKLMEKQALRRIEAGQLNAEEIERVGNAFFLLDEKIEQLKETFGLKDEDLNLDLGPLGELL